MQKLFTTILLAAVLCAACSKDEPVYSGVRSDGKIYIENLTALNRKGNSWEEFPVTSGKILVKTYNHVILAEYDLPDNGSIELEFPPLADYPYSSTLKTYFTGSTISLADPDEKIYRTVFYYSSPDGDEYPIYLARQVGPDYECRVNTSLIYIARDANVTGTNQSTTSLYEYDLYLHAGWNTVVMTEEEDKVVVTANNAPQDLRWIILTGEGF